MPNDYAPQDRGDSSAYASYFAGMDSSMQQKVALTTAFFLALPGSGLQLRALAGLAQDLGAVRDGHLKIALLRLLHALAT